MTTHTQAGQPALAAGCDEYETRPVEVPRLLGTIQALLGGAAPPGGPFHG